MLGFDERAPVLVVFLLAEIAEDRAWEHGFDVCFSTEQAVSTWDPMDNQFLEVPT